MPTKWLALSLFVVCACPYLGEAQRVPEVGDRVRVHTMDLGGRTVGTVQAISAQGVELADENGRRSFFAASRIRELDVSQGRYLREGRKGWAALAFAGIIGAGAGIGAAAWSPCTDTGWFACFLHPASRGNAALVGGVIGLPVAVLVAKGLGQDRMTDSWGGAALPSGEDPGARIGLFTGASPNDIGVGISIPLGGR